MAKYQSFEDLPVWKEDFRIRFLRNLKPEHPLQATAEAQAARTEAAAT
jgi:hypothetical protein